MYENYFNYTPQENMKNYFLNEIAPLGDVKHYKRHDQIDYFKKAKLAVVLKGQIKICIYTKNGLEKILFFLLPGEIYGEESLFYPHIEITPVPLEDTSIAFINNDILEKHFLDNPENHKYIFQSILRKYQISLFQMGDLLKSSPRAQICSTLYRMATQYRGSHKIDTTDNSFFSIYLTHEVLANIIGCSRVTVTRVLNQLKCEDVIDTLNKEIVIKDFQRLKTYADL